MYNPQTTVDRIREMRENNGISVAELNEACGLNKNTIAVSANSKNGLSAKILSDVSKILGCSTDYLLGRTENPQGINQINTGNVGSNSNVNINNSSKEETCSPEDETVSQLVTVFKTLDFCDKAKVMSLVAELSQKTA